MSGPDIAERSFRQELAVTQVISRIEEPEAGKACVSLDTMGIS